MSDIGPLGSPAFLLLEPTAAVDVGSAVGASSGGGGCGVGAGTAQLRLGE